uniref:Ig-like domain-containing protein n=1 Tax=Gasterosteus aculeatus aculeatus TaxID=481459 RepID=G3Q3S2_GASAC
MLPHLLLLAALLAACSGPREDGPSETVQVQALAGDDILLPCSYRVPPSNELPTVEWSKKGLEPNVVLLYRDGCETPEMKNPAFWYRTSLVTKELTLGNISLRIGDVRLSDAGSYRCTRLWKNLPRDVTEVQLVVGAASEPKLSVTRPAGGGVALQCTADCWLPEPRISFLDGRGDVIEADEPKRDQDARGCFSVGLTATLQDASGRVTCRVHQADINQTREVEETLPDVGGSCFLTGLLSCVGTTCLLLTLFGLASFFCRRHKSRTVARKLRTWCTGGGFFSPNKGSSEGQSMLTSGPYAEDENKRNAVVEAEVKQLRLTVAEQADTIHQLLHNNNNNNNNGDDGARLDAVVCHTDRPACPESPAASPPADAPHALKRRHSSPPRLTPHAIAIAAAPPLTRPRRLSRSLSEPFAGRERVQRRHSVASAALQRVAEESEVLLPREEPDGLVCDFTEMLSD